MNLVAAAAVRLGRQVVRPRSTLLWPTGLEQCSGFSECDVVDVVRKLRTLHWGAWEGMHKGTLEKYEGRPGQVSRLSPLAPSDLRFGYLSDGSALGMPGGLSEHK